jgi:hypothetical protein
VFEVVGTRRSDHTGSLNHRCGIRQTRFSATGRPSQDTAWNEPPCTLIGKSGSFDRRSTRSDRGGSGCRASFPLRWSEIFHQLADTNLETCRLVVCSRWCVLVRGDESAELGVGEKNDGRDSVWRVREPVR